MKKLLVTLMAVISVVGLNAYAAGPLKLINLTNEGLAVYCLPSGNVCNDIGQDRSCSCPADDTVMYFGYDVIMPQSQTYLDEHTTFTTTFVNQQVTDSKQLGAGNVWKVLKDMNDPDSKSQVCVVTGVPDNEIIGWFKKGN